MLGYHPFFAVGFDGVRIWANPRCARALKMQYNLIDLTNDYFLRFHMCCPPRAEIIVCAIGTMTEVLVSKVNTGIPDGKVRDYETHRVVITSKHVAQEDMWMTENPGAQHKLLTGSFQPIDAPAEEWYNTAYKTANKPAKKQWLFV